MLQSFHSQASSIILYTESRLRAWLSAHLKNHLGPHWIDQIPPDMLERWNARSQEPIHPGQDPLFALAASDIPDCLQIAEYKSFAISRSLYAPLTQADFNAAINALYSLRNIVLHNRMPVTQLHVTQLLAVLEFLAQMSPEFFSDLLAGHSIPQAPAQVANNQDNLISNLPTMDYQADGGFVGRRQDLKTLTDLLTSNVHRVISIVGPGGTGKTALAHQVCTQLADSAKSPQAILWMSAKTEVLTSGIEELEPHPLATYASFVEACVAILYDAETTAAISLFDAEQLLNDALESLPGGILFCIDNLETIEDEQIRRFIIDLPPPHKCLITSRIGLGQVERRYELAELADQDAKVLLRTVARQRQLDAISQMSDEDISRFLQHSTKYPLAIKWVLGQLAAGRPMETVLAQLANPAGDLIQFCFRALYEEALTDTARHVLQLLSLCEHGLPAGTIAYSLDSDREPIEDALALLQRTSLVLHNAATGSGSALESVYSLGHLTRKFVRATADPLPEGLSQARVRLQGLRVFGNDDLELQSPSSQQERIAQRLIQEGRSHAFRGDFGKAESVLRKAIVQAPNYFFAHLNLGNVLFKAQWYEEASVSIQRALDIQPDNVRAMVLMGHVYRNQGRLEEAEELYMRAFRIDPENHLVLFAVGECHKAALRYDEADSFLRKALVAAVRDGNKYSRRNILNSLCQVLMDRSVLQVEFYQKMLWLDEAQKLVRILLESQEMPPDERVFVVWGHLLMARGRTIMTRKSEAELMCRAQEDVVQWLRRSVGVLDSFQDRLVGELVGVLAALTMYHDQVLLFGEVVVGCEAMLSAQGDPKLDAAVLVGRNISNLEVSKISRVKDGYGFLENDLFFHFSNVVNRIDLPTLRGGLAVRYVPGRDKRDRPIARALLVSLPD